MKWLKKVNEAIHQKTRDWIQSVMLHTVPDVFSQAVSIKYWFGGLYFLVNFFKKNSNCKGTGSDDSFYLVLHSCAKKYGPQHKISENKALYRTPPLSGGHLSKSVFFYLVYMCDRLSWLVMIWRNFCLSIIVVCYCAAQKKTTLPLIFGRNEKYAPDSRLRKTYLQIKSYFDIFEKFLAVKALMTSAIYIADKFYTSKRTLEIYHKSCHCVEYRLRAISANPEVMNLKKQ